MRFFKTTLTGCLFATLTAVAPGAWADYPDRPVTLVVPFAAGGPTDALARIVSTSLEKQSGQPFVVENVAGAGSTIGTARVAAAKPDGYTLLWGSSSAMVIAPHLYKSLRYDPLTSFQPVGRAASFPYILSTSTDKPFQTYDELVAYGKKNPGKLNYGSPGAGTSLHLTLELMMGESGFTGTHVPFKGSAPALTALIGGEIDYVVDGVTVTVPMIEAGRLRPLAVTGKERITQLPDVPTLHELGLTNFESKAWFAMFAPAGTPQPIVEKLQTMLTRALQDPAVSATLAKTGFMAEDTRTEVLEQVIRNEHARWGKLIQDKNLTLE